MTANTAQATCPYCLESVNQCRCAEYQAMHKECCAACVTDCASNGGETWDIDYCTESCCDHC